MSIDVSARNVKLWINEREGRNGNFRTYSVSASRKNRDGSYTNKSVKLFLSKDVYVPERTKNGSLIDFEGFLTVDVYEDRNGVEHKETAIFATTVKFLDADDEYEDAYTETDEEVPF